MANLFDTSIAGIKENPLNETSSYSEVFNSKAIQNALRLWITSYKGDTLRQPSKGGYVTRWLFKPMTEYTKESITLAIQEGILNDFKNELAVKNLIVEPNYEKKYWKISLDVYSISHKIESNISVNIVG